MKSEVLDILILGLLVVLFASIYRKRASARLRFWLTGWSLVVLHFAVALFPVAAIGEQWADSISTSALFLSGACFLFSVPVLSETVLGALLASVGVALPAVFYINYVIFSGRHVWPLYAAATITATAGIVLAWCYCRGRSKVWTAMTVTFFVAWAWTITGLLRHDPDQGVLALLFEIFLIFAALYWFDFRRVSPGVMTSIIGLMFWASVFPVSLLCEHLVQAGQIPPGLWNVPKYFVAFGMFLTLLEDQFLVAGRAVEHYRLLFAAHPHPMWVQDPETLRILEVNQAAVEHYGYQRDEFQRMTLGDLRPKEEVSAILKETAAADSNKLTGPWSHRRKDGSYIQVDTASHLIDFHGRKCHFVMVQDVTERQLMHEQLFHHAHHDALTGLPNRLLLEDRMQQTLAHASRYGQQAAVLCLDLDRFKQINDTFGHAAGDACLQQLVSRVSGRLRAMDTFARVGGDEFVLVLGELANRNSALMVARNILEAINKPVEVEGRSFDISGSIGISIYPDDGLDPAQLRRSADAAMYRAKQAGGSQYVLASSAITISFSEGNELERTIRSALKDGGLSIYYQPQFSIAGNLCGMEATLRLNHPQLGILAADRFLPLAEETGLVVPLGDWVLDEICRQSVVWRKQNLSPVRIAIRVSPPQFLHTDFSTRVLDTYAHHGIDPQHLEVVVTENTVTRDRPEIASQMRSLAASGVHFSVADFGSSYSCLSHLHQLPVSALKIDSSFVERISDPNGTYTIVQAIIALAHGLGLTVMGEGVERADQLECLRALGCDSVQGHLMAPALPSARVAKYLSSTTSLAWGRR
jgi:diguanylate cyclase (GGDEF)-like protein/PAS domain S-box-containing protein